MEQRPNPEKVLQRIQAESRQKQRGKLRIYLGAAPGVGKTFTMLEDALAKRTQGLDVVAGVVESHGRKEIESLLNHFEILPKQKVEYREKRFAEFDLDAALKRKPALFLIDEMAHTNIPGLRHAKRWQDIKEILDRGIDVYTTLNVQHIESLNDVVTQIIESRIQETVPDSMIELADTIELVDLPPEDLLKRLQEGKIYFPQQANLAKEKFFRIGNLIALRELALRTTAERVGEQVLLYRQGQDIKRIWPIKEKILVCVGTGPETTKLIRAARRMAASQHAEWVAVHVDTPKLHLSEEQRNKAIEYLHFAEQLGAEIRVLTGFDIVKEIMNFAHEQNVTQIMIWKQIHSRWRDLFFKSLADEVVRHSLEIDVYIVTGAIKDFKLPKIVPLKRKPQLRQYSIALGVVVLATLIDFFLHPILRASNLIMVYLLGVTTIALFGRVGPSILASLLSVIAYDFFFIPPLYSLTFPDLQYFFTLLVMLIVALIISNLTILTKRQSEAAVLAQNYTAALQTLSQKLATARGVNKLLEIATRYIGDVFNCEVIALLPENDHLTIQARYGTTHDFTEKEYAIAHWVFELGQKAGIGTDTLPYSDSIYIPLSAIQSCIGVLRLHPYKPKQLFTPEQMHLLDACAHQLALALEVDRLQDQTRKSELLLETNRARNALLQSVSHDLRTPLVKIMATSTSLIETPNELTQQQIKKAGNEIYTESEQLSRLINNLLQINYLEAEAIHLQKEFSSLREVITPALNMLNKKLGKKPVHINLPKDLPTLELDATLIQEVFFNLIDNAIKFTPTETPIEISATIKGANVVICVADQGPGIVPDEVNKLFEKFYRGRLLTTEHGLGLGLAICRSIIKAHGGQIWAENHKNGGAAFYFTLPIT